MIFCGHCVYEWLIAAPALLVGGKHLYSKLRDTCSTERLVTEREVESQDTFLPGCRVCDGDTHAFCGEYCVVPKGTLSPELHAPLMTCADSEEYGTSSGNYDKLSDAHTKRCCPECGCKYGEDMTCSVARGWKKADARCEYCAYRERECRMCS